MVEKLTIMMLLITKVGSAESPISETVRDMSVPGEGVIVKDKATDSPILMNLK